MATQAQSTAAHSNSHTIQLIAELVNGEVQIRSDLKGTVRLKKDTGPHDFTFHLQDKTFPSMGVRFCTVAEGLLDVDESSDCPPKKRGINTDQVDPQSVTSQDKKAGFTDSNSGPERSLSYALHFKCDDPAQNPIFDPEIRNGGGTAPVIGAGVSPVLIAAGVAAATMVVVYLLWFR
jgi:hypothetical protein